MHKNDFIFALLPKARCHLSVTWRADLQSPLEKWQKFRIYKASPLILRKHFPT